MYAHSLLFKARNKCNEKQTVVQLGLFWFKSSPEMVSLVFLIAGTEPGHIAKDQHPSLNAVYYEESVKHFISEQQP